MARGYGVQLGLQPAHQPHVLVDEMPISSMQNRHDVRLLPHPWLQVQSNHPHLLASQTRDRESAAQG